MLPGSQWENKVGGTRKNNNTSKTHGVMINKKKTQKGNQKRVWEISLMEGMPHLEAYYGRKRSSKIMGSVEGAKCIGGNWKKGGWVRKKGKNGQIKG